MKKILSLLSIAVLALSLTVSTGYAGGDKDCCKDKKDKKECCMKGKDAKKGKCSAEKESKKKCSAKKDSDTKES